MRSCAPIALWDGFLHDNVPTITKNMMSVRQIVTKGCRSGSPTSGALSRKKAKSSCKATRREDVLRNDQPKPAYTYAIWVQRSRMTKTCKTECTSTETHNLTWKTRKGKTMVSTNPKNQVIILCRERNTRRLACTNLELIFV
mgnify:CR=1 FL=1